MPDFTAEIMARLTAMGATPADRRNAVAVLAMIAAGVAIEKFAVNRALAG